MYLINMSSVDISLFFFFYFVCISLFTSPSLYLGFSRFTSSHSLFISIFFLLISFFVCFSSSSLNYSLFPFSFFLQCSYILIYYLQASHSFFFLSPLFIISRHHLHHHHHLRRLLQVLWFKKLREHHSGAYTCEAANAAATANHTASIKVKVSQGKIGRSYVKEVDEKPSLTFSSWLRTIGKRIEYNE